MPISVTALSVTAVKGTRLRLVEEIELEAGGARGDRRFYVIDERCRMQNAKGLGALQTIVSDYSETDGVLSLTFPDGREVRAPVDRGETLQTRFFSTTVPAWVVSGPWSEALSEHLGQPLRLVEPAAGAVDRGAIGAASVISRASLARLASEAGQSALDARRFRMLVEVEGISAHEEDGWVGRRVQIGDAIVGFNGHVGRCLITSRDPDSGEVDLPTLDILGHYRRNQETSEPLAFGIYGEVIGPGRVRLGDSVSLLEP